jgi:putative aminopeptidase FrvX
MFKYFANLNSGGEIMDEYINYIMEQIKNLTSVPSPSGYTDKAVKYIEDALNGFNIPYKLTNKGAVIAVVNGMDNSKERVVSAHIDTLGAMVKGIKDNGRIAFDIIGGYMLNSVECENCIIETAAGKQYTGTILTIKPSIHIHSDAKDLERKLENTEIVIDEKVNSKKDVEKLGINVGDFVFLDTRTRITESGFIKSRHLDDKASAGILLGMLKYISENHLSLAYKTSFYFSNYEEVGHGAASCIPDKAFEFLSVDMGAPGIGQNSSEFAVCICAKDSSGPYDFEFRKRLVKLCIDNNIDYKVDMYPRYGSDASCVLSAGYDVKTGLIGTGVFASHSYERTHRDGILNTAKLLKEYLISK